ncbi:hypothetical protein BU15DRAFT_81529 [Melanogaster broomeanus]|nr:hypothetical protein BU15DRAFT_81529 [Melanogaster broomeanus]
MDPITAVSTAGVAIQLFQVAIDVSSALHQYIAAIKGAESSYSELIDQITLISKTAQAAQSVLENPPSFRTSEQQALHTEWFRRDGSPARCKKELEDLLSWLRSQTGGKTLMRGIKKVFWPVKEKRIRAAIQAFDLHMPCFNIMLSLYNSSWLRGIHSEIKNEHEHARSNKTADATRKLLKWLDGLDCTVKHETSLTLRQKTTGEWLLNEELYRDCATALLAGAGKSVLASTIIDNLSSGLANNETLAYFYCDFRTPRSTSTMEILRSLTVQFLRNSKFDWLSSKPFSELVTRKEQGAGPPVDIATNSDLLRHAARLHPRPMIVVDALDECDDLSKLLDELVKLDADGHCRVFVTARPLHSINLSFKDLPSISLGDMVDAVRKDMYFHINTELESRDKLKTLSRDLQEEIRVTLMEKANGMFRLVQLQLDRLNGCWSLGDLREALETLPGTLYETYDRMLRDINKKDTGPPDALQLAQALTINVDKPAWDSTFVPMHETSILEICGSFVSYNEQTRFITLSHYSVKEYLTSKDVADKTYFIDHPVQALNLLQGSPVSLRDALRLSPPEKLRPEYNDRLLGVLVTLQDHVSKHHHIYGTLVHSAMKESWMTKISQLALYIIIRFGHVSLLRRYLDHHSILVTKGANPLVYAALYADVPRCQMLLDSGLDIDVEAIVPGDCDQNMLPLIAAAFNQDQAVLMLLVGRTAVPRDAIHFVLQVTSMGGVPQTRDVPEPSTIDYSCNTVQIPCYRKLLEFGCLLVKAGGDPAALNDEGLSPFHLALREGDLQFVQWLIAEGFRLPPDAILHAARSPSGHLHTMFQVLFDCGIAVDAEDGQGNNALHILSARYRDSVNIQAIKTIGRQRV